MVALFGPSCFLLLLQCPSGSLRFTLSSVTYRAIVNCFNFVREIMLLKKLSTKPDPKKAPITTNMKKEIIRKYEEGKQIIDIARELGKASSTIATILKKKEDIKALLCLRASLSSHQKRNGLRF